MRKFGMNDVIASVAKQSLLAIFLAIALVACGDDKNIRDIKFDKKVIYYGFNENSMAKKHYKIHSDKIHFHNHILYNLLLEMVLSY